MANTDLAPEQALGGLAQEDRPVLETIMQMHLDTLANCTLDEKSYHLVRIAALVAMGAPPASYMVNLGAAVEAGLSAEDAQGVLVAVAPIVGTPRVTAAAGNMLRGLGLAEALAEE
jgi:alkylhydroperoxidase/carboxymuconolactone decarboxylase family protein YurZ